MPVRTDAPTVVRLSDEERATGVLSSTNLYDAVAAFHRDGLVVLDNAIPVDIIDKLNERMMMDTDRIMTGAVKGVHWNQGIECGNISQVPPLVKGYLFPEIYANKSAAAVLNQLLGPKPELHYVRSNTLIGHAPERQDVHRDIKGRHIPAPTAIAMNVCLIDAHAKNGSTEIWLGTHREQTLDDFVALTSGDVKKSALEKRRQVRPPMQPDLPKGSLVLRDLRLWHAGMHNETDEIRVMLALVYTAAWYKNPLLPPWPKSVQAEVEALGANNDTWVGGTFYDDEEKKEYLAIDFDGNFGSSLEDLMVVA
ncbi:uncharacterized protein IL334_005772 [Kwoniella shivajii]|uniref:Phytanoyl-CoA dioxygenase n=1 Tax=Kwoniella shivajii TaxID=564305 RepID=A0ABZ1D5C4_9TREE|nr:hypothetical protein IL334_005772 [Kwoniella shivajii]